jgi:probable toxin-antitoxin system toxin component, PIN family
MRENKKVIIDTNLWIRFLISQDYSVIDTLLFEKKIRLVFSKELLNEFIEVAQRAKFRRFFSLEDLSDIIETIEEVAEFVEVTTEDIALCRDEKDNFLLCLASDASADYLITEDNDLLVLNPFEKTEIMTMKDFLLFINNYNSKSEKKIN